MIPKTAKEHEILRKLGANIKAERLKQKLTQSELAERTGISLRHLQNIETGKVAATMGCLYLINLTLKISFEKLFKGLS